MIMPIVHKTGSRQAAYTKLDATEQGVLCLD